MTATFEDHSGRHSIAFAPGVLCTRALFADQIAALSPNWNIVDVDTTQDDTLAAMARRFLAMAPETFVLVGLSMGGYLSLEIMRQAPERVRALVLMDTSARADDAERLLERDAECARVEAGHFDEVKNEIDPVLVAERSRADPDIMSIVREMSSDIGPQAFIRQSRACGSRIDSRASLADIRVPTLALVGAEDDLTPLDMHQEIVAAVTGAELAIIERAGHLPTVENPKDTTLALLDFLARNVP